MLRFMLARHNRGDEGATAVEYGLMVAAIAALIAGTVGALGGFVQGAFDKTCSALSAASPKCVPPTAG
jgi:pilus assembly protein Flp/PilA